MIFRIHKCDLQREDKTFINECHKTAITSPSGSGWTTRFSCQGEKPQGPINTEHDTRSEANQDAKTPLQQHLLMSTLQTNVCVRMGPWTWLHFFEPHLQCTKGLRHKLEDLMQKKEPAQKNKDTLTLSIGRAPSRHVIRSFGDFHDDNNDTEMTRISVEAALPSFGSGWGSYPQLQQGDSF